MEPVAYLEVLDRHGRVAARHRVGELPLYLGRGYTNDVILDDLYVSPRHARITMEGGRPTLIDAGSENGIVLPGQRRVERLPLETGARFRLGRTDLRFCTAEQRVGTTLLEEQGRFHPLALTRTTGRRLAVAAIAFIAVALQQFLSSYQRQTWEEPAGAALAVGFFVALWAGGWALANRIVAHASRFWTHFLWAALLLVAFFMADGVFQYLDFLLGIGPLGGAVGFLATILLAALLVSGHLRVIGQVGRRRRVVTSLVVAAAAVFVIAAINEVDEDEFSNAVPEAGPLKPLGEGLLPRESLDEFVDRTADLKEALDELTD